MKITLLAKDPEIIAAVRAVVPDVAVYERVFPARADGALTAPLVLIDEAGAANLIALDIQPANAALVTMLTDPMKSTMVLAAMAVADRIICLPGGADYLAEMAAA